MVSAGLLLLLLMSTSFVLSSPSAHLSTNQQDGRSLEKRGKKMERFLTVMEYTAKISKALSPFIGLIPVVGQYINLLGAIPEAIAENTKEDKTMTLLKFEFKNLNAKIDKYHTQDNWNRLTSIYQEYETTIKLALKEFENLKKDFETSDTSKNTFENFKKTFGTSCTKSTYRLHTSLTAVQPSFNTDFGKSLIEYSRCHEKIIKDFTILIEELFWAGITVTHFLNKKDNLNKTKELANMALDAGSVMFEIHKHCIINTDKYVRLDVQDLIDEFKERGTLAKEIRQFLEAEFDNYDWLVVAFLTDHSSHSRVESLNKHTLSDAFIREEKVKVTVAVAKQLKGTHTKAAKVKEAIEKCLGKQQYKCHNVIKTLDECNVKVEKLKLKDTYTAVHAFISKSHESANARQAKEAPEEYTDFSDQLSVPYIYTGNCKKYGIFSGGHFSILIKSDEEMSNSPCAKLSCGEKGKCVVLKGTLIPVCECDKGFYGENCEESIKNYINHMQS